MTDERIQEIAEKHFNKSIGFMNDHKYTSNIDIEDAIRETLASQWISVEDGLPEPIEGDRVIYLLKNGKCYSAVNDGDGLSGMPPNVTHWMPIPEPPKP
jgi:hypothetical protein